MGLRFIIDTEKAVLGIVFLEERNPWLKNFL
jgi:hypothetical protein